MNSIRGGMQVHGVPDSERAFDASGRKLPWGYEYSDAEVNRRREPEEKGPFGRSTRRRGFSSRSKTATPARKEDAVRLENMQHEDAIFNSYKATRRTKESIIPQKPGLPMSASEPNVASSGPVFDKEPTEIMLYGFGPDQSWAAIEFYERISGGEILEDYDRHPPQHRYDLSLSYSRATAQRNLTPAALRKRNAYRGGEHWLKVTFDSAEAAGLAVDRSPHALHGYLVYAEPFLGRGPPNDAPIPFSNAGAQIDSDALPKSFSTNTLIQDRDPTSPADSSKTASSATIVGDAPPQSALARSSTTPNLIGAFQGSSAGASTALQQRPTNTPRSMRLAGAKRAELLPAEQAFLPTQPRYTEWLVAIPLIGLLLGGKSGGADSQIPRLEDGSFDWKNAGLYWQFFAWLDQLLGTDMCGLKSEE